MCDRRISSLIYIGNNKGSVAEWALYFYRIRKVEFPWR